MASHTWYYPGESRSYMMSPQGVVMNDITSVVNEWWDVLSRADGPTGDFVTPNSFSNASRYVSALNGKEVQVSGGWQYVREGVLSSPTIGNVFLNIPTSTITNNYNQALDKLMDKVRGSLDLSVDAFQLGKTRRMFNLASTARQMVRDLRRYPPGSRGARFDPRALVTLPSGVYLNWKYGWKPLLSTVYDTANEILSSAEDRGVSFRGRHENVEELRPVPGVSIFGGTQVTLVPKGTQKTRCEVKVRVRVPTGAANIARFTSMNPAAWAYELVPYSFVYDYFVNVSGYLRNLETAFLWNKVFESGYVSHSSKVECRYKVDGKTQFPSVTVFASGRVKATTLTRSRSFSFPAPKFPIVDLDLGAGQMLTVAALLGSKLK